MNHSSYDYRITQKQIMHIYFDSSQKCLYTLNQLELLE